MIYIYIAGPLFSEADIIQRRKEAAGLREVLDQKGLTYYICNPIDLPFDNTQVLSSREIFLADYGHLDIANVFFFDLSGNDTGTLVELGNVIEKYHHDRNLRIYPVFSDLRLARNQAAGLECPVGYNSYVVGCLSANEITCYRSFSEALTQFVKDIT